jgi:predicted metal-binding membrane protein
MTGMTGTTGPGLAGFAPARALMMAAMMLPSVTPAASLHAKTFGDNRAARTAGRAAGYLAVRAAASLPAYGWPGSLAG